MYDDYTNTQTFYVIGGPMLLQELSNRDQKREQRNPGKDVPDPQPVILPYYGTGDQPKSQATWMAGMPQPSGTTYEWSTSGPIEIIGGDTASSCIFQATGGSARGGAHPILTYSKVYDGKIYSCGDASTAVEKAMSCHVPVDVRYYTSDTDGPTFSYDPAGLWTAEQFDYLYIVSNIGDPLEECLFQERYQDHWDITQISTGQIIAEGNNGVPREIWRVNTTEFWTAGKAAKPNNPGYLYQSKDRDTMRLTINSTDYLFSTYQSIYAGTIDPTPGAGGIRVGGFQLKASATSLSREKGS